jgi:uroporphyrinogen III methyltransferase/synthase
MMIKGKVYIIGAGPGDPKLITVKGLNCLKQSDVILYDRLANDELLSVCKANVEKIYVGKQAGNHHMKQEDTIALMIKKAGEGKTVARLKGGDPLIFGRGSEEAMVAKEAGLDFEIVPGVTAAIGASCYAGIPLTHRNLVTQAVFITAHEAPGKDESQVDWATLAKLKNTNLCIYMGVGRIREVVSVLIDNGLSPETPAAAIQNGTMTSQRSIVVRLKDLPEEIEKHKLKPPVLTIIGPTANMKNEISWFETKPFFGKRIVSTRATDQRQSLYDILTDMGATVIPFSVIKTELTVPEKSIADHLKDQYDWIIFTSENGVRYFMDILMDEGLDARAFGSIKIAAIGSATGNKLREYSLIPDYIPNKFTSASLLEEMPQKHEIMNKRFLRIKGDFEKDPLTEGLIGYGGIVDTLEVYRIIKDTPGEEIIEDLKENGADAYLFTSGSTVKNFFDVLGETTAKMLLENGLTVSIGPLTSEQLSIRGIKNINEAEEQTINGLAEKLEESLRKFITAGAPHL